MSRIIEQSNNRQNIFHFLQRGRRFHANCTIVLEFDVTALMSALRGARAAGADVGFVACLVKATGLTLAAFPRLNRHFYRGLWRSYFAEFDHVSCGLVVLRTDDAGEEILLPAVIDDVDRVSIAQIQSEIVRFQQTALAELPEYRALERLRQVPRPVRALISTGMARSHRVHQKLFKGTYGISAYAGRNQVPVLSSTVISPAACSFTPGTVRKRPWVVDDEIQIRDILPLSFTLDHFVLDGAETLPALDYLGDLLATPSRLGLPVAPAADAEQAA